MNTQLEFLQSYLQAHMVKKKKKSGKSGQQPPLKIINRILSEFYQNVFNYSGHLFVPKKRKEKQNGKKINESAVKLFTSQLKTVHTCE